MTIDTKRLETDAAYWDECGAPEDATHYCPVYKLFYDDNYPIEPCCIPRPTKPAAPEWVDGLPTTGAKVECTFAVEHHDTWHKGKVTFKGIDPEGREFFIVDTGTYQAFYRSTDYVRPLRTKDQRDRDALVEILGGSWADCNIEQLADAIIAAGWTKP